MRSEYRFLRNRANASRCSRTTSESATWDSHAESADSPMRRKMPSPRTSLAGTQVGLSRASGARLTRSRSCGSGASSRVNPVSARTSRSRSACTTSETNPASGPGTPPRRSAKSSVGSGGGVAVKMSHSGVSRSGYSFCWSSSPASAVFACCSMASKTVVLVPLVQDLELGQRPEGIEDPPVARVLQLFPQLGDLGLQLARPGGWHGERGQGLREPRVGCADDNRDRLRLAFLESARGAGDGRGTSAAIPRRGGPWPG